MELQLNFNSKKFGFCYFFIYICNVIKNTINFHYMDKGYYRALRDANGDESKVHYNYGWYSETHITGPEYDEDGLPIAFT